MFLSVPKIGVFEANADCSRRTMIAFLSHVLKLNIGHLTRSLQIQTFAYVRKYSEHIFTELVTNSVYPDQLE